jgi:hypothetical protein
LDLRDRAKPEPETVIALGSTASVNGRLLSQTAVTLINNTVVRP